MHTEKISTLTVSDFVAVASRGGTAYSVVSISIDGQGISNLSLTAATRPNSGQNVLAAFRGKAKTDIVGWLDPVTNTPIIVIPKIVTYYPVILMLLFPLLSILLITTHSSHKDIWVFAVGVLVVALVFIQAVGWPGVARYLKKAQAKNEEKHL